MRIVLLRRRPLSVLVCALVACAMFAAVNHPAVVGAAGGQRRLPISRVQLDYKAISLTFDTNGGDGDDVTLLADILGRYRVAATFFVSGDWAARHPEAVAALHAAGQEVMCGGNGGGAVNALSRAQLLADLTACNETLGGLTGAAPTLFRPPSGGVDDHVVEAAHALGMEAVGWSVDGQDRRQPTARALIDRVTAQAQAGGIVLLHSDAPVTAAALPDLIEALQRKGYALLPVSRLLLPPPYTVDHAGRQQPDR